MGNKQRKFFYIDTHFHKLPSNFVGPPTLETKGIPVRISVPGSMKEGLLGLSIRGDYGVLIAPRALDLFKKLLASEHMNPVWAHLDEFSPDYNEWSQLIVEALSEPVAVAHSRGWRKSELDHNLDTYSLIAEKANDLIGLLGNPIINGPGFIGGVSEFVEESELSRLLLKLLSMTTSCRWPDLEYRYCYEASTSNIDIIEMDEVRSAETYQVRKIINRKQRPSKESLRDDVPSADSDVLGGGPPPDLLLYGEGNRFIKVAFKPNDAFSADSNLGSAYEPRGSENFHEHVIFTDQGTAPPTFAPPDISLQGGYAMTKGGEHTFFLKEAVYQMVRISYRRGRNLRHFENRIKGKNSCFWLPAKLWAIILGIGFPGYNEENDKNNSYRSTNLAIQQARADAIRHVESGEDS